MKKIIPYILITVILLTGVLTPFGVGITNGGGYEQITLGISYVDAQGFGGDVPGTGGSTGNTFGSYGANSPEPSCNWDDLKCHLATLVNMVLELFALILGGSGVVLDLAVKETVLQMGANVKNIGAIDSGWRVFRDVANVVIIFALLAIGFATILRISSYGMKELLAKVIIIALLINFSLFFTKVIIDSGNLLAVQFYSQMTLVGCGGGDKTIGEGGCSISGQFMQALSLTSIYETPDNTTAGEAPINYGNIIVVGIMGSILFLITAFVFFAGAFLLIIRFVALIFMMVLSPLAFAAMILPATSKHASKWWGDLINYTIFAPIYFLLIWFVLTVVSSDKFRDSIGLSADVALTDAINVGGTVVISNFAIILNFIIVIFFMIGAILISRQLGIAGSEAVMKAGNSARKWGQGMVGGATVGAVGGALRGTVGRGASALADSEYMKDKAKSGLAGRLALRGLQKTAGSSFDVRATAVGKALGKTDATLGKAGGKGGYEQKLKDQVKAQTKMGETIGKASETKGESAQKTASQEKLTVAQNALGPAQERLRRAQAQHKARPTEASQRELDGAQNISTMAQNRVTSEETKIKKIKDDVKNRGEERKEEHARNLSRKGGRKNKMSAEAIRKKKTPTDKMIEGIVKGMEEKTPKPEPKEE